MLFVMDDQPCQLSNWIQMNAWFINSVHTNCDSLHNQVESLVNM